MSIRSKLHIHRWKPVSSASDLQAGVFTVTAWCRCNEIEVKLLAAPQQPAPPQEYAAPVAVADAAPESE